MKTMMRVFLLVLVVTGLACGGNGGDSNPSGPGAETYSVSGRVIDANGNGVSDVTVTLNAPGQTYTKTTSASGTYSFSFQTPATFTVTAARGSFDIAPQSREVVVNGDMTGIDFTLTSAIIRFNPVSIEIPGVGQTNRVWVAVDHVTRLYAASFTVLYDPVVVEVTEVKTSGDGFFFTDAGASVVLPIITTDDGLGRTIIDVAAAGTGFSGADGSGYLAQITFRGKSAATAGISFLDTSPLDLDLIRYPSNGTPEHELALPYTGSVTVR